jgi:stress-induced morphogen
MGGWEDLTMATERKEKSRDDDVQQVRELLAREYQISHASARIDVYRQNSASIRIRVIDPDFRGMNRVERDRPISQLLGQLPEMVESQITLLLLLTPEEQKMSLANFEFEHPVPSSI